MNTFVIESHDRATFKVDTNIFSDAVIAKVMYWLSGRFIVSSITSDEEILIKLESEELVDWAIVKLQISQMFIDYNMREVINRETKDIRTILYIKAFANRDDFVEYEEEQSI